MLGTLIERVYNAGRHEKMLRRKLTDDEWQWYLKGWMPASVKAEANRK